jgi:hypothetical protein
MSVAQEQTVLDKIQTRGYWRVVIRPTTFEEHHLPNYSGLFPIVEKNSVRFRGWDYPHVGHQNPPLRGADWVGQEIDWQDEIELWRLYMSGQFVHFFTIWGDWRDHSSVWPAEPGWKPGRFLYYVPTAYSFVEIFEFAARLALSPAGAPLMRVEIELHGLQRRQLVSTDIMVPLSGIYVTQMGDWNHCWKGSQTELIAEPRKLAAVAARELFARFGLDLSLDILTRVQARIGR